MTRGAPAAEAMIAARRRDSHERRARVTQAIEAMLADGTPITFTAIARHAKVSTWRDEIKRLRAQVEQLHDKLRRALGTQLDNLTKTDLITRVDELLDHNTRLLAETHQLRSSNDLLTAQSRSWKTTLPRPEPASAA